MFVCSFEDPRVDCYSRASLVRMELNPTPTWFAYFRYVPSGMCLAHVRAACLSVVRPLVRMVALKIVAVTRRGQSEIVNHSLHFPESSARLGPLLRSVANFRFEIAVHRGCSVVTPGAWRAPLRT